MSKVLTTAELDALERQSEPEPLPIATRQAIAAQSQMSPTERFTMGVARPVLETAYGAQQLLGRELSPEQRHQLAVLRANKGAAGTTGRVAGEIATFALPGGAAAKGARALPNAVARFARAPAEIASAAAMEAVKSPTDDRSRGQAALEGVAGATLGTAVGALAAPVVRGVQATPAARALMDRGIPLTPGMATNGWRQALEDRLAAIPGFAGVIRKRQRESLSAWNRDLLQRVTPDASVSAAGHQGFRETTDSFTRAYESLWQRELPLDLPVLGGFWQSTVTRARQDLAPETAATFAETLRRAMNNNLSTASQDGVHVAGPAISKVDDILRAEATNAARRGEGALAEFYRDARRQLKERLPKDFAEEWTHLDSLYKEFATLRRAAGYKGAATQSGVFTPDQLLSASIAADKSAGKGAVARGTATLQREATEALGVLGGNLPGQALGTAEKLALPIVGAAAMMDPMSTAAIYGTGRVLYSPWMRSWLTSPHAETRAVLRALRGKGLSPAAIGAALEE